MSLDIRSLISQIDASRIARDIEYLASDPLPCRKVNFTVPGHEKNSLDETDEYIEFQLAARGWDVGRVPFQVQAFRCDETKPRAHRYSAADPSDPWHVANNVVTRKVGESVPDEIILLVSHKDSPSWADCPGAHDNAVGTAANLEIARILADVALPRTVEFLFCNEEHAPWTSVGAANAAAERGDSLIAVLNQDSLGGKSPDDFAADRKVNVTGYTTPEGERLAELMARVNEEYEIGLAQSSYARERPGDDDGSFINAGFPAAVINVGSLPFAFEHYHVEGDTVDSVDVENVAMAAQAVLAATLTLAVNGR
ncbi:MAG TPA: M28 family peptidase [Armatimonadota bacterium]|nr:M28 family peptidase [Armatimonadota bacterium]